MDENSFFTVGAGKEEITPPLTVPYLGFKPRHSLFTGVHDPLFVRSVVISDGTDEFVYISFNAIGFANTVLGAGRDFTREVRSRICKETGILPDKIMVASSHIHSTPDTLNFRPLIESPGALEWLELVIEKAAAAVKSAAANSFKARLKCGKGSAAGISRNRRNDACIDNDVTVMLFESLDKCESIILVNYACHPVVMQVQELVSADFVGVMENAVENAVPGIKGCLFVQGACGDINPIVNDSRDFRDSFLIGTALAGEVLKLSGIMGLDSYPVQPVSVKSTSRQVLLPSRPLPDTSGTPADDKNIAGNEEAFHRIKEGDSPYSAEIQLAGIGGCLLTGIPGEVFCVMGKTIKEESRPLTGIVAGYANGYLGYIAPPEVWEKGSYEVALGPWSKVGPQSPDMILEVFREMKRSIYAKTD